MHILRVVLNSGSMTELMYDTEAAMRDACDGFQTTAIAVAIPDQYGHEMYAEPNQIAALICVDLEEELRGHSTLTFERQMMQDRLSERVHKMRDLAAKPIIQGQRGNGMVTPFIIPN